MVAECRSKVLLKYFGHALSDIDLEKTIFGLFESGRFTEGLL